MIGAAELALLPLTVLSIVGPIVQVIVLVMRPRGRSWRRRRAAGHPPGTPTEHAWSQDRG